MSLGHTAILRTVTSADPVSRRGSKPRRKKRKVHRVSDRLEDEESSRGEEDEDEDYDDDADV